MTTKTVSYWISTVIIVLAIGPGGIAQVIRAPAVVGPILHFGYPMHFIVLLGVWKALGAVALLVPGFPLLKEWAYAGIFFELTGAVTAVTSAGGNGRMVFVSAALAACLFASWTLRPDNRRVRRSAQF